MQVFFFAGGGWSAAPGGYVRTFFSHLYMITSLLTYGPKLNLMFA